MCSKGISTSGFISTTRKEPVFRRRQRPYSVLCEDLMRRMLFPNHPRRIETAGEALQHEWFDEVRMTREQRGQQSEKQQLQEMEETTDDDKIWQEEHGDLARQGVQEEAVAHDRGEGLACKVNSSEQEEQAKKTRGEDGYVAKADEGPHVGEDPLKESGKRDQGVRATSPCDESPPLSPGATTAPHTDTEDSAGGAEGSSHDGHAVSPTFSRLPTLAMDSTGSGLPAGSGSHAFCTEGTANPIGDIRGLAENTANGAGSLSYSPTLGRILGDLLSFIGQNTPSSAVSASGERSGGRRTRPLEIGEERGVEKEAGEVERTRTTQAGAYGLSGRKEELTASGEGREWGREKKGVSQPVRVTEHDASGGGSEGGDEGTRAQANSGKVGEIRTARYPFADLTCPSTALCAGAGTSVEKAYTGSIREGAGSTGAGRRSRTRDEIGDRGRDSSETRLQKKNEGISEEPQSKKIEGQKGDLEPEQAKGRARETGVNGSLIGWFIGLLDLDDGAGPRAT